MVAKLCVRVAFALTIAAAGSGKAMADERPGGWYVMPSYHETGLNNANNKLKTPAGEIHFNSSFGDDTGAGIAVGDAFSAPYRVDVEYQYHSNDLKVSGTPFQSTSLDTNAFAVNVWRDFGPWHNLRPYIGVGLGGGTLKFDNLDGDFYFGQFGVGVQWFFTNRVALDIAYRYQQSTSNPELNGNGQKLTTEYSAQSAQIGFRVNVWGF